jgi:hypothetical protein
MTAEEIVNKLQRFMEKRPDAEAVIRIDGKFIKFRSIKFVSISEIDANDYVFSENGKPVVGEVISIECEG